MSYSFLSPPTSFSAPPVFGGGQRPPLQPGDRDYCARCAAHNHSRYDCPDRAHATGQQRARCPHGSTNPDGSVLGPQHSASQVGTPSVLGLSLGELLQSAGHGVPQPGQQVSARDVLAQPGFGSLDQQEAQALADLYNDALRRRQRADVEARLQAMGVNPSQVLGPAPPPTGPTPTGNLPAPQTTPLPAAPPHNPLVAGNQSQGVILTNALVSSQSTADSFLVDGETISAAAWTGLVAANTGRTAASLAYVDFTFALAGPHPPGLNIQFMILMGDAAITVAGNGSQRWTNGRAHASMRAERQITASSSDADRTVRWTPATPITPTTSLHYRVILAVWGTGATTSGHTNIGAITARIGANLN